MSPTDAPAGPELRVEIRYRDSGGYQVEYEIVYDGDTVDDGRGSFECQLCTEDELIEKVEALAKQVAPKMVVPQEDDGPLDPEIDIGPEVDGGNGGHGTGDPTGGDEEPGKLQGMGKAGIGLLVVGGAAAITGVGLLIRGEKPYDVDNEKATNLATTVPHGAGLLAGGGALLIVGAVLLGIDRKRAKERRAAAARSKGAPEAVLHPWLSPQGGGVGVTGRF
ncbi:MAG: hypothetical protein KDK70_23480 [Myxococcales bacterium]|nr:hypothetical protein [Myxococcales bacterium]